MPFARRERGRVAGRAGAGPARRNRLGRREHGRGAVAEGAAHSRLFAQEQTAVGRRRDDGADLCRDSLRCGVRRRGDVGHLADVRLAAPAPRGLYGAVRQVLGALPQRGVVQAGCGRDPGAGTQLRLYEGLRTQVGRGAQDTRFRYGRRLPVRDVFRARQLRRGPGRRGHRHLRRALRRRPDGARRPAAVGLRQDVRVHGLPYRDRPLPLRDFGHRRHRDAPRPYQGRKRLFHALRLLGQMGLGAHDAVPEPRAADTRLHGAEHGLPQVAVEAQRVGVGRKRLAERG